MGYILGIDNGTSGTKTILCDETGAILADVTVEYPCYSPKPSWSEQDAGDWWDAAVKSTRAAIEKAGINGSEIVGIGLSGQMHGLVCLDKGGNILRRAILWNDQRTVKECAEITEKAGGLSKLLEMVSNPALTGFTAPKVLWVRNNEPEIYEKTAMMLLPKDYIRYKLTGEYATEVSDASGTLLLDVKNRCWSKELLEKLDIDISTLPTVFESAEVSGVVSKEAAEMLGIPAGTPVAGGGGDQAAGAVGNGIVKKGIISAMMGTSGVVFAHSDKVETDPQGRVHTFCHAVPGKWHMMSCILAAGGSFQWFKNNLANEEIALAKEKGCDPYELLTADAAKIAPGCEGLFFLPYLTGERSPHNDPFARGCFIGLTPRHNKASMARAVMEGATYAMHDTVEIMRELGVESTQIRLSGGGARSPMWAQMQADIYGCTTALTSSTAGSAYGAMILGGVGAKVWDTVPEACDAVIKVTGTTEVNPEVSAIYKKLHPMYQKLYKSLKANFKEMAILVESL